jgi:peptidoglycan/LPS O-acetylase OafA/YrhL
MTEAEPVRLAHAVAATDERRQSANASHPAAQSRLRLQSHLPSLDGMRAISILLVLLAHACGAISHSSAYFDLLGQLGVSTFFVISGLLITWLMIRERDATGQFSLPNFYVRRFLRIIPVFWLLLLTVSALKWVGLIHISWLDIVRALTFTHNYPLYLHSRVDYAWWLHHTWSLSLEEQFYLVWPSLFALLPRKRAAQLAAILAISGPFLRLLNYYLLPVFRGTEAGAFQTRIDILMAGCAAAFLLESPVWRHRMCKIPVWPTLLAPVVFLFVIDPAVLLHFPPHTAGFALASITLPTLEALVIAAALVVLVAGEPCIVFRVLNSRFLTHIGKLSFSLYVWQQLFFEPNSAPTLLMLFSRLFGTYLASLCSFRLVERPLVRLRSKFRKGIAV